MELSTALIVKNELNNLKELIPQISKFSDEIVIADTGSTDGTLEFLKNNNIIFKKIKWNNDFSYARNESVKLASKDFIMWLDADDRVMKKDIEKIIKLKRNLSKKIFMQ